LPSGKADSRRARTLAKAFDEVEQEISKRETHPSVVFAGLAGVQLDDDDGDQGDEPEDLQDSDTVDDAKNLLREMRYEINDLKGFRSTRLRTCSEG
jgi:hypothetical protein